MGNLPNLDIETNTPNSPASSCELFYNVFLEFNLDHMVTQATHTLGNRLDLILTSKPEKNIQC